MMKVRSYVDLTPEDEKLLEENFEVLITRDGAEIVIAPSPVNFGYYLDKEYYPNLKIIVSQGSRENFTMTRNHRSVQVIAVGDDVIHDLIRGGRISEKYLTKVKD